MKQKTVLGLIVVGAILGGTGLLLTKEKSGIEKLAHQQLYPTLNQASTDLTKLKITGANQALVVEAVKEGENWLITNLDNYPADKETLRKFVSTIKAAKKVEPKTAKKQYFEKLGLRDIQNPQSQGMQVDLYQGSEASPPILLGLNAKNGSGQYVRFAKEHQTWLIDKVIQRPEKPEDWIDNTPFHFALKDVKWVKSDSFAITKLSDKDKFVLDGMATGMKLKYDSVLDALPRNVADLNFDKIVKKEDKIWDNATSVNQLELGLFDGTRFQIKLFQTEDEKQLAQFALLTEGSGDYKSQSQLWQKWGYELSNFNFSQLNKKKEDFIEPLEEAKE
ncbi:DUF4340 domain-containing protein [Algicola sagamiensis]|uniref:DUF4340 domain-containing protein n=1 Tax=Algicola sagamiensis TaxID=163869 RepID=UPI00039B2128|nr:DUF4340 domain-containing protein [Algicola sagamiensis]